MSHVAVAGVENRVDGICIASSTPGCANLRTKVAVVVMRPSGCRRGFAESLHTSTATAPGLMTAPPLVSGSDGDPAIGLISGLSRVLRLGSRRCGSCWPSGHSQFGCPFECVAHGRSTVDVGYFDPTDLGASLFLDGRRNYSREFLVDTTQHTTKSRAPYVRTNTVLFGIHTNSAHPDRIRVDAHRCQCQVRICSRCGRGQLIAHPRSPPERAAATSSFIWAASTTPGTSVSPTTKAGVPPMRSCRASARTSPR